MIKIDKHCRPSKQRHNKRYQANPGRFLNLSYTGLDTIEKYNAYQRYNANETQTEAAVLWGHGILNHLEKAPKIDSAKEKLEIARKPAICINDPVKQLNIKKLHPEHVSFFEKAADTARTEIVSSQKYLTRDRRLDYRLIMNGHSGY